MFTFCNKVDIKLGSFKLTATNTNTFIFERIQNNIKHFVYPNKERNKLKQKSRLTEIS